MTNVIQFKRKQPAPKPEPDDMELTDRIQRIKNSIQNINKLMEQLRSMGKEKE